MGLSVANSEDLVAAVLAHEIGHVLARHGAENMTSDLFIKACKLMLGWTFGIGWSNWGSQLLYELPHSRIMEAEADYISILLLLRAGYNPHCAVDLWRRWGEVDSGASSDFDLFSTHPSGPKRLSNIQRAIPYVEELEAADKVTLEAEDIK